MSERSRRAKSRGAAGQAGLFPAFRLDDHEADARAILDGAVELHRPSAIIGLFSGGHDSLCACHVASRHPLFAGCAHVNTGIGIERTRQFVRDTCRQFGWPLRELHPPPFAPAPEKRKSWIDYASLSAYEALVLHHGFPGPSGHRLMYNRLKERCLRRLVKERKHHADDRVLLVSGVRRDESTRRMGINQAVQREGCRVWVAPLLNWDGIHKREYMSKHRLPRNEVVEVLCMSGECCCGAFARPHEIDEIAWVAPETAAYIRALELRARESGLPRCQWGAKPPSASRKAAVDEGPGLFSLCWSCGARADRPGGQDLSLVEDVHERS
jgi:3'-phosphoadenosine 5'-phosphosulfate sulfotransferase (PAPS reductase)/FAD synthetase